MGIDDVYILCTCCRVHSSQITQVLFRETDGKYLWLCKNTQTVTYRRVISLGYCDGIVFTSNQLLLQHFIFMPYCLHEWQKNNCPDSFRPLLLCIFVKHINSCLLLLFSSYTSTQLCVCMCIRVCVYINICVYCLKRFFFYSWALRMRVHITTLSPYFNSSPLVISLSSSPACLTVQQLQSDLLLSSPDRFVGLTPLERCVLSPPLARPSLLPGDAWLPLPLW